jgi:hypothetical protein
MDDQGDIRFNFSEITEKHESTELPEEWLKCGRKSTIIAGKYQKIISAVIIIIHL